MNLGSKGNFRRFSLNTGLNICVHQLVDFPNHEWQEIKWAGIKWKAVLEHEEFGSCKFEILQNIHNLI